MAKVVIDAGHGGREPGAIYEGRREKDDNLRLALAVGNILERNGVEVAYTRTEDVYNSPLEKAQIANREGGDFLISFHRNSSPEANQYSGVESLVFDRSGRKVELAENINRELERVGFRDLGVKERPGLVILRRSRMPAVLVETGFLNTDVDNERFDRDFDEIAQAVADGILQTLWSMPGARAEAAQRDAAGRTADAGMMPGTVSGNSANTGMMPGTASGNSANTGMMPGTASGNSASAGMMRDTAPENTANAGMAQGAVSGSTSYAGNGLSGQDIGRAEAVRAGMETGAMGDGVDPAYERFGCCGNPERYYRVQTGAFRNRQYAEELLYQLQRQNYPAWLLYEDSLYKVQVGAYRKLDNAVRMEQALRRAGYSTFITT